jgi:hypothetical protein
MVCHDPTVPGVSSMPAKPVLALASPPSSLSKPPPLLRMRRLRTVAHRAIVTIAEKEYNVERVRESSRILAGEDLGHL